MKKITLLAVFIVLALIVTAQKQNTDSYCMFHYDETGGTVSFIDEDNMINYATVNNNQIVLFSEGCQFTVMTEANSGYYIRYIKDSSSLETTYADNVDLDTNITIFAFSVNTFTSHNIYVTFEKNTPLSTQEQNGEVLIYPNPVTTFLTVKSKNIIHVISIYSASGVLFRKLENINTCETSINFREYLTGIYFVVIDSKTLKIIKK